MMNYTYLFGPVQSRRLGVSLGIDMVQSKQCSLDCVYCECGKTTELTLERKEYVPAEAVIAELTRYLAPAPKLDYITFGGSGEPTLNSAIGRVLRFLKTTFPGYQCALLTNGTLFHLPGVCEELLPFDIVLPSLDAVSDDVFFKINRPHPGLDNRRIIEGLVDFRKRFTGTIWLEIFIIPGVNDTPAEIALFREACMRINPDRVQLNSLDRPGTCSWVEPAPKESLERIAEALKPLPVEIISRQPTSLPKAVASVNSSILSLLTRRPSTVEEIAVSCGLTINQVRLILSEMVDTGIVNTHTVDNRLLYRSA
jgi:wyosine [tRNA(Phe)-imidazoG37] synthetase (radical SAM superfamily)